MKLYVAIIPWDYARADADVFRTKKEAQEWLNETKEGRNYGVISETELQMRTRKRRK